MIGFGLRQKKFFATVFDVVTELAKTRRNYVVTETICVSTELAATENSAAHNRDGVQGLGTQRHALGAYPIEARARQRSSVTTENSLS